MQSHMSYHQTGSVIGECPPKKIARLLHVARKFNELVTIKVGD